MMKSQSNQNSPDFQQKPGLTNVRAVEIIMEELDALLAQKEMAFQDQRQKGRQQFKVAARRFVEPGTLLAIAFVLCTIYNS